MLGVSDAFLNKLGPDTIEKVIRLVALHAVDINDAGGVVPGELQGAAGWPHVPTGEYHWSRFVVRLLGNQQLEHLRNVPELHPDCRPQRIFLGRGKTERFAQRPHFVLFLL